MKKYDKLTKNAAGRIVPEEINGEKHIAFKGVGKHIPEGRRYAPKLSSCANYPLDGNKLVPGLKEALIKAGLKDGMTISTHHHFRMVMLLPMKFLSLQKNSGLKIYDGFPLHPFHVRNP